MASFDTQLHFTNIHLQEKIVKETRNKSFFELLTRNMSESLILFYQAFYKQHDGVAMGSTLGQTLVNVFVCYHEKFWLQNCPFKFKPVIYRRYVDNIFLFPHRKIPILLIHFSDQK